jgi:hypothetical protein
MVGHDRSGAAQQDGSSGAVQNLDPEVAACRRPASILAGLP